MPTTIKLWTRYSIWRPRTSRCRAKSLLPTRFLQDPRIDSLQALDLLTRLENHFNVELPDYELQGVSDFRTLASRIQARL